MSEKLSKSAQKVQAAAGTPHALLKLTPQDLERITKGAVTDLT
jgi:prolyl-tRNA editing enzyme YbaK/EbsC (Cys-tRNA(Pro) deacylase)